MTNKELKFAEEYAACGNATQAALRAGYSESTATNASRWLDPKSTKKYKKEVAEYINQLGKEMQSKRILTVDERKEILSDIARSGQNADRIKAVDVLNKMSGEYITKVEGNVTAEISNPFAELTTDELRKLADDG